MRILLAQINPTVGDIPGNTEKILDAIAKAKKQKAQIVLFPELCFSGYPPEDFLLLPHFIQDINGALDKVIAASKEIAVIVGLPRQNTGDVEKPICNSAAIIENQTLIGFQDKILLPTYDVFTERRFFEPGSSTKLWRICNHNIGITICEDIWQHSDLIKYTSYNRDPVKELAGLHPDVVLNLSASPFSVYKAQNRIKVCTHAATTLQCPLLLCNQVGGNDSLIFDGYSIHVDSKGNVINMAKGFAEDFLLVDLNTPKAPITPSFQPIEDLYHALVLGLKDYFSKSNFSKACLGLSGGIDSALVACIAVDALGKDNVVGLIMPSRFSSESSVTDALQLANTLGIKTHQISIEKPFQTYLDLLGPYFKDLPMDTTEENLQARTRGTLLMAFSNKFHCIVLSTGNKSEMAMGYATLYGDMCGGLSVINDVTKQQVYALASWINRHQEIIPTNTIKKPPSAELRANQKDTDSLPDYSIVDNVLQAYIEDHLSPDEISLKFSYPHDMVLDLIKRIHQNEYKRRQAPPGLRVSEKAFSVGRRFPIVQRYVT